MTKILSTKIIFQDYSDCDSGLPSHWCAIIHHTGSCFAEHIYAGTRDGIDDLVKQFADKLERGE